MIRLHGFAISNYHNAVKFALLEKGIDFEEVEAHPSQDPAYLAKSPMGKIPYLETPEGCLSESQAILHYLERAKPEPALYPKEAFLAGKAQQLHQMISLYMDTTARKLLGAAFFGKTATQEEISAVSAELEKVVGALNRAVVFGPFIAGDVFTHADIIAGTTLSLPTLIMTKLGAPDPMTALKGLPAYKELLASRPAFQKMVAEQQVAFAKFMASRG